MPRRPDARIEFHFRHEGDRHRCTVCARVSRHAVPGDGREADAAFAVCAPCPSTRRHHDRRAAGRPSRRDGGAVLGQLRPVDRRRPLRSRIRAMGARVLRRRMATRGPCSHYYATHHRHTCIAARAGFGDLLIGAGALMCEANGFPDPGASPACATMVELISIVEGFYACGVAASVYGAGRAARRHVHARRGVREHRQAPAGRRSLRHAPAGARGLGRPDRHPPRPRRRPQPGDGGVAHRGASRATPTCRTTSASRWRASSRT